MCSSEVWLPIPSQLGYEASSLGNFRLANSGLAVPTKKGAHGYHVVKLFGKIRYAHCLIAEAFLGPRPPLMDVDHIDRNQDNNTPHNLAYRTRSENTRNADRVGCGKGGWTIPREEIPMIVSAYESGERQISIAKRYGVRHSTISKMITRHRKGLPPRGKSTRNKSVPALNWVI